MSSHLSSSISTSSTKSAGVQGTTTPNTTAQSSTGQSATDAFAHFQFNPLIEACIKTAGYSTPTPIQAAAIPRVMQGGDLLGLAQTGTGKTAAFVLPILQRLLSSKQTGVRALVLAPTRELAEQIHQVVVEFSKRSEIRSCTIYGGVAMSPQVQKLRNGAQFIVACPGRLLDHIRQRTIDLRKLEVLVLDEADQMFDMGFLPTIRQILKNLPASRQTLMFSATMPDEIRSLATDILRNPETIQIAHGVPTETVAHSLFHVEKDKKSTLLLKVLEGAGNESVLIFTRTKHQAKRLDQQLQKSGFNATSIQGNLSQNKRQRAMDGFRQGKYQVLVATDIAARGIDVSAVKLVVNFDIPSTPEAYTHRIGRTGRAAQTGKAYTFVAREDLRILRAIEREIGKTIDCLEVEGLTTTPSPSQNFGGGGGFGRRDGGGQPRRNNGSQQRRNGYGGGGRSNQRRSFSRGPSNGPRQAPSVN